MPSVVLREVHDDDLPALFEHQSDPGSVRMTRVPARDWAAFAEHRAQIRADPEVVWRAIVADGELAGDLVSFLRDGRREVEKCGFVIERADAEGYTLVLSG